VARGVRGFIDLMAESKAKHDRPPAVASPLRVPFAFTRSHSTSSTPIPAAAAAATAKRAPKRVFNRIHTAKRPSLSCWSHFLLSVPRFGHTFSAGCANVTQQNTLI